MLILFGFGGKTVYRMNTFPFIHLNVFHAIMNSLAIVPLLERFEAEYGTLTCLGLFFGRELHLANGPGKDIIWGRKMLIKWFSVDNYSGDFICAA